MLDETDEHILCCGGLGGPFFDHSPAAMLPSCTVFCPTAARNVPQPDVSPNERFPFRQARRKKRARRARIRLGHSRTKWLLRGQKPKEGNCRDGAVVKRWAAKSAATRPPLEGNRSMLRPSLHPPHLDRSSAVSSAPASSGPADRPNVSWNVSRPAQRKRAGLADLCEPVRRALLT